jgi:hypothetical protein
MGARSVSLARLCTLIVASASALAAQPPASARPCDQITAACTAVGFTQGGVGSGTGLQIDCVIPIMQGTAQPAEATRPLPQIPPQVVAACKVRNPNFGQGPISEAGQAPLATDVGVPSVGAADAPKADIEMHKATTGAVRQLSPSTAGQLVNDSRLNVWWLAEGNLAATQTFGVSGINKSGSMDYQTALRWVQAMNAYNGTGYLGHKDWQLPTAPVKDSHCDRTGSQGESFGFHCSGSALGSLYYNTLGVQEPNTAVSIPSNTIGPFTDFQPYLYWSKSAAANPSQGFVSFSFNSGFQGANVGRNHLYVLPMVKGKLPGTPPAPAGGKLQVNPGGATVYDPMSQVTWLADANLAATQSFGVSGISPDGSMEQSTAVLWIDAMNKADHGHGYLGATNWDLPETGSSDPSCSMEGTTGFGCTGSPMGHLYYSQFGFLAGQPVVSAPNIKVGSFHDIQPYLYWACEAPTAQSPCSANGPATGFEWNFSFGDGFEGTNLVQNYLYVMVYYPGPMNPIYKGPDVLLPNTGKPTDSASRRPSP